MKTPDLNNYAASLKGLSRKELITQRENLMRSILEYEILAEKKKKIDPDAAETYLNDLKCLEKVIAQLGKKYRKKMEKS